MTHEMWGYAGFVLGMVAYVPYNVALWKKTARPRVASWIVWASLDWASFFGMLAKDEINGTVLSFCVGATITLTHILIQNKSVRFGSIDKICLGVGFLSLVLWALDGDPTRAIVLMAIGLMAGNMPTIVHVLHHPEDEDFLAWSLYGLSVSLGLLAVSEWTVAKATTPVVFAMSDAIIFCCLVKGLLRKRST